MAIWVIRLHGRGDVFGPRDMRLFGGPFIEGLITGVPDTVTDARDLEEVLEAAGMDPDCGQEYVYSLCRLGKNTMRDEAGDLLLLSYREKEKLRELAGTEKHLDYSEVLRRAQQPVFAAEPPTGRVADNGPVTQGDPGPAAPRVVTRPKDLARWHATWQAVKGMWGKKSYPVMLGWLSSVHSELACAEKTLRDICMAGAAGLLD